MTSYNSSIIMDQEKKFNKYQNDITKQNKLFTSRFNEGFVMNNPPKCTVQEQKELESLEKSFNSLLSKYQILKQESIKSMDSNLQLYNVNNPYKNKNIKFSNNVIGYVTNENVFKRYVDGIQTIPGNFVLISSPYKNLTTGKTINTTPPLIVGTPMQPGGQTVGNEGSNVVVTQNSNISDTYLGCYNDTSARAMTMQDGGSQNYNHATCKARAIDTGAQYFGLQDVNSTNGLSQCFTSNDLTQTTQYGLNVIYDTTNVWNIYPDTQTPNSYMVLQSNGDIYFYDQSNNLLTGSLSTSNYGSKMNQTYLNNCLNGGYISNVKATYGLNCATSGAPSNKTYSPPNYPNVVYNNVGPVITDAIGSNTRKYTYQIGVNNSGQWVDPAPGCWKNFDLSYNCGTNLVQIPTMNGKNPGTDNKLVTLNCNKYASSCNTFIVLEDSGKMVIYIGTNPTNYTGTSYSFNTTKTTRVANPNYVAVKGKTGVNWLASGTGLMSGEWIGSNDGSMYLIMNTNGTLSLVLTTTITNNCTKSVSDGKTAGGSWTNAVYELASISDPSLIGSVGYVSNDSVLNAYPSNMVTKSENYLKYTNYDSSPYDISGGVSGSYGSCKKSCDSNPNCSAFVLDSSNNCYLKSSEAFPVGLRQPNTNTTLYVRESQIQPQYSNTYTTYYGQDSSGYDVANNPILNSTNESCQDTCNNSPLCAGYVYSNGSCWIKYKIPTSNITTASDETTNVYIRNTQLTPYNTSNYVKIDTNSWNSYVNNGTQMSYTDNPNIKQNLLTNSEQSELNEMEVQLYLLATQISNKIQYFEKNNVSINNQLKLSIDEFKKNVEQIKDIKIETGRYTNTNTTNSMLSDSDLVVLKSNYSYLGFSILAIIIVIITMNKIK